MSYAYEQLVQEDETTLQQQQRRSSKLFVYQRLQMLRLFKLGQAKSLAAAAQLLGVTCRSVQTWWKLYRQQGLSGLLAYTPTRQIRLSSEQQQALLAEAATGAFSTINEMARWVEQQFCISYTEVGMWRIARRLGIKKKTARPRHVKQDAEKVAAFKKVSRLW
jgi:transposase